MLFILNVSFNSSVWTNIIRIWIDVFKLWFWFGLSFILDLLELEKQQVLFVEFLTDRNHLVTFHMHVFQSWTFEHRLEATEFHIVEKKQISCGNNHEKSFFEPVYYIVDWIVPYRDERLQKSPLFIVAESYGGKLGVTLGLSALEAIEAGKLKLRLGGNFSWIMCICQILHWCFWTYIHGPSN